MYLYTSFCPLPGFSSGPLKRRRTAQSSTLLPRTMPKATVNSILTIYTLIVATAQVGYLEPHGKIPTCSLYPTQIQISYVKISNQQTLRVYCIHLIAFHNITTDAHKHCRCYPWQDFTNYNCWPSNEQACFECLLFCVLIFKDAYSCGWRQWSHIQSQFNAATQKTLSCIMFPMSPAQFVHVMHILCMPWMTVCRSRWAGAHKLLYFPRAAFPS